MYYPDPTQKIACGGAYGKLILTGEHAVVYGMPAIAMPFPLVRAIATVKKTSMENIMFSSEFYQGPLMEIPDKLQGIATCVEATLQVLNKLKKGLDIHLHTTIPIGRGLGSSAAIAIAVVRGVFAFHGKKPSHKELMSLVRLAETFAHGNPSGIDMEAASASSLIWFQKGKRTEKITIARPVHVVVADTGMIADTHEAVSIVGEKYKNNPIQMEKAVRRLGTISIQSRKALAIGNARILGRLLNLAHAQLVEFGVSNRQINQLIHVARMGGALGAKLTGGGLGGCVLAIAENRWHAKKIATLLMKVGAQHTWYFKVSQNKSS